MNFFKQKVPEKSQKSGKNATTKEMLKSVKKCIKVSKKRDFIVSVLLSAHAERVGVSRMRDFIFDWLELENLEIGN